VLRKEKGFYLHPITGTGSHATAVILKMIK
jgi:hypothetical protein